jgi:hypothetical protein
MKPKDTAREIGFHRESAVPPGAKQSDVRARGDAPVCVMCHGPPSPFLVTPGAGALCEACATDNHPVAGHGATCRLCGTLDPPVRGVGERTVCDGCLCYARAIIQGDDL